MGGSWSREVTGPGGALSGGCLVPGGSAPGGCLVWGGAWSGGMCLVETPLTASAAGGTHPTGMHSCFVLENRI